MQHRPGTNLKSLEHYLDFALAILIQTNGILAHVVIPQARKTLKAINVLVFIETPTYDPLPSNLLESGQVVANSAISQVITTTRPYTVGYRSTANQVTIGLG